MELKKIKLSQLIPYENNPRNNEDAVEAVKESIRQCGYVAPIIVDENMVILAGHTRYKALNEMAVESCEVIIRAGLSEEQKKKYRILDNKTNEFAGWDFEKLEEELAVLDFGGFDFGFDKDEESKTQKEDTDLSDKVEEIYQVIIDCSGEIEQEQIYNKLNEEGYSCRVLTL